ncbi:MAG: hypothetical protein R3E50_09665 [Halioglobus sp.]
MHDKKQLLAGTAGCAGELAMGEFRRRFFPFLVRPTVNLCTAMWHDAALRPLTLRSAL